MLLRTSQQLGIDETFRNPPWDVDVGNSSRAVCQPLGRQSLGTHPALGQCDRCLMLESSNPFPGFAKPPWFCQESRPQAWGSAPCFRQLGILYLPYSKTAQPTCFIWTCENPSLIPITARYLAAAQPVVPAACSDLDLLDCQ